MVKKIILSSDKMKVFIAEKDYYTGLKTIKTFYNTDEKIDYIEFKYFVSQLFKNNIDYILELFKFGYNEDLIEFFNLRHSFLSKTFYTKLGKLANNIIRRFNKTDNILLAILVSEYYIQALALLDENCVELYNIDDNKFNKINKLLLTTKERYSTVIKKLNINFKANKFNEVNKFVTNYINNVLNTKECK